MHWEAAIYELPGLARAASGFPVTILSAPWQLVELRRQQIEIDFAHRPLRGRMDIRQLPGGGGQDSSSESRSTTADLDRSLRRTRCRPRPDQRRSRLRSCSRSRGSKGLAISRRTGPVVPGQRPRGERRLGRCAESAARSKPRSCTATSTNIMTVFSGTVTFARGWIWGQLSIPSDLKNDLLRPCACRLTAARSTRAYRKSAVSSATIPRRASAACLIPAHRLASCA